MDTTVPTTPSRQTTLDKPSSHGTPSPMKMTPPAAATTTNDKHAASSPASPGRGKMHENADGSRTPVVTRDTTATTAQSDHTAEPEELSKLDRAILKQSLRENLRKLEDKSQEILALSAQMHQLGLTARDEGEARSIRTRGRQGSLDITVFREEVSGSGTVLRCRCGMVEYEAENQGDMI